MADRLRPQTLRRTGIVAIAVLLFWLLAWPWLSGSFTWQSLGQGAAIALNLLLISVLGLLYRPDRARGFRLLALSLSAVTLLGLLVVIVALDGFFTLITTPKPL